MACGVPAVSTDAGDAARIVGQTGWVVAPRQPEALAEALLVSAKLERAARNECGAAARARVCSRFSLATFAERHARLYRALSGPETA